MTLDFLLAPPFPASLDLHSGSITAGARFGKGGGHLSRTLMLEELTALLENGERSTFEELRRRVVEDNCLGKATLATRKSSFQRLRELYGLDSGLPLFAALLYFWHLDPVGHPLLAMELALARDPLFRCSAAPILASIPGVNVAKPDFMKAIEAATGGAYGESMIDKIARHTAASWGQTGHLSGRVFKVRQRVAPTPAVVAFAAFIGYCCGLRGEALFVSVFARLLDTPYESLLVLAAEANRLGFLSFRQTGGVIDVSFPALA